MKYIYSVGPKGTAGGHWEKTSLQPELMTGSEVAYFYYSKFTVLTLEATKNYIADMHHVTDLSWGRHHGCEFAEAKCEPKELEFCDPHTPKKDHKCSADYMGVAHCDEVSRLAPGCGLWAFNRNDCRIDEDDSKFSQHVKHLGGKLGG